MKIKNLRHECGQVVWDVEDAQGHYRMNLSPDELELVLKSAAEFAPFIVEARKHRVDVLREQMYVAENNLDEAKKRLQEEEQALNGVKMVMAPLTSRGCWKCNKPLSNVTTGIVIVRKEDIEIQVCGSCAELLMLNGKWKEIARAK